MSEHEDRMRKTLLSLNEDEVAELARLMNELDDAGHPNDESESLKLEAQLNRDLIQAYEGASKASPRVTDPTCLNDQDLWTALQRKLPPDPGRAIPLHRRPETRIGLLIAAAALLMVFWQPWSQTSDWKDQIKGVFQRDPCQLAFEANGQRLETPDKPLPGSSPVQLSIRCEQGAFVHLRMKAGSDQVAYSNIPLEKAHDWQRLRDEAGNPIGLQLPAEGSLDVVFGMSGKAATGEEEWSWKGHQTWSIREEARP